MILCITSSLGTTRNSMLRSIQLDPSAETADIPTCGSMLGSHSSSTVINRGISLSREEASVAKEPACLFIPQETWTTFRLLKLAHYLTHQAQILYHPMILSLKTALLRIYLHLSCL